MYVLIVYSFLNRGRLQNDSERVAMIQLIWSRAGFLERETETNSVFRVFSYK